MYIFHFPLSHPVVFIPLLTSVQAILTANGLASLATFSSSLVLFLRQTLTLTKYMIYCFTLFATVTYKRGVHGLVYVELNMVVCSQCLLLLKLLLLLLLLLLLREEDAVCEKSNGDRTGNVHSPSFHDHRWNGG